jgi:hypothetical protein
MCQALLRYPPAGQPNRLTALARACHPSHAATAVSSHSSVTGTTAHLTSRAIAADIGNQAPMRILRVRREGNSGAVPIAMGIERGIFPSARIAYRQAALMSPQFRSVPPRIGFDPSCG